MTDLTDLLERAAGPDRPAYDAAPDLTRGRRALSRTRARRGAAGLAGVAAAGVLGVGLTRGGDDGAAPPVATDPSTSPSATPEPTTSPTPEPTQAPTTDPSAPVTGSATPTFFDIGTPPEGWEIQGSSPYGVIFARPGDTTSPDDFEGKIALMFSANPVYGEKRVVDGRPFWVLDSGEGYLRVTARSGPDEPQGRLELQYPADAGWTPEQAIAWLSGVRALDGAVAVSG